MDYPALTQLPQILAQLRAANPNAPAATTYYTPQNSGEYNSVVLGQLDDLNKLINANFPLPASVTSTAYDPRQAMADDDGGGDFQSQRLLANSARNAWNKSDAGQANKAALAAYYATPQGQARQQLEALQKQASSASEDQAANKGGWIEQRLDDTTDFWGKYGTPIVAALMTAGIGSAVAGAAGAGGLAGSVGVTNPVAVGAINGAAGGAAAGGAINTVSGQSVGQGLLSGAISGGVGGGLSAYNPAAQLGVTDPTAAGAINGAVKGGVNSALSGGDVGQGLLSGGLKGGASTISLGGLLGGSSNPTYSTDGTTPVDQSGPDTIDKLPQTGINLPSLAGFVPGGDNPGTTMDDDFDWQSILQGSLDQNAGQNTDFLTQLQNEINGQVQNGLPDWAAGGTPTGADPYLGAGSSGSGAGGINLGSLGSLLSGTSGTTLAGLAGALAGGLSGGKAQQQIDPRMAQYLYGTGYGDPNSMLGAAQQLYQTNKTGLNPTMQQGLDMQKAALTDPAYAQGYQQMRTMGGGLLGGQIAGNPFTSGAATLPGAGAPAGGPTMQAGGPGGLLGGGSNDDRIKALIASGRGLIG